MKRILAVLGTIALCALSCAPDPPPSANDDLDPNWSHDSRIAFRHLTGEFPDSRRTGLYVLDTLTREIRLIAEGDIFAYDWIPETDTLVASIDGTFREITADGGPGRILAEVGFGHCSVSPDGRYVAIGGYTDLQTVFILDRVTLSMTNITPDTIGYQYPAWSPDGSELLVVGWAKQSGVYRISRDGTPIRRITPDATGIRGPQWAPVGGKIAWIQEGEFALWVTDSSGATPQRLSDAISLPTWSPDAKAIAFAKPNVDFEWGHFSPKATRGARVFMVHLENGVGRRLTP